MHPVADAYRCGTNHERAFIHSTCLHSYTAYIHQRDTWYWKRSYDSLLKFVLRFGRPAFGVYPPFTIHLLWYFIDLETFSSVLAWLSYRRFRSMLSIRSPTKSIELIRYGNRINSYTLRFEISAVSSSIKTESWFKQVNLPGGISLSNPKLFCNVAYRLGKLNSPIWNEWTWSTLTAGDDKTI